MEHFDREELKMERKRRKKEKREARKLEKEPPTSMETCVIKNERGEGLNKHVTSKSAIQVSLVSLCKTKEVAVAKKCENKIIPYTGNALDSSHPERFKGKRREEPKVKKLSTLKANILKDEQLRLNDNENEVNLINYCNNLITEDLNSATKEYIRKLVQLQENAYSKDPVKAKIKKRYVLGFHELKKKLLVGKIKFFIIATDIKIYRKDEGLYKIIEEILQLAENKVCPHVFAIKRSKLGNLSKFNRPASCFGVLNHHGAEEEYQKVLENILTIPVEDYPSLRENDPLQGIFEAFKKILTEEN